MDFTVATIQIKNTREEKNLDKIKHIPFRNIIDLILPSDLDEKVILCRCSKTYKFPFFLHTIDRKFELCASSENERKMWMSGFNYIKVSTQ